MEYIAPMIQVLFIVSLGMLLARLTDVKKHVRMLSALIMYILIPAVVFRSAYRSSMRLSDCAAYYGVLLTVFFITLLLSALLSRLAGFRGSALCTTCLIGPYSNNGAAGYTIIQAFLGEPFGGIAAVASAYSNVLINITGPMIIQSGKHLPARELLLSMLKMPVIYTLILGYALKGISLELPPLLMTPIEQLAASAFPLCLLLIGIQMQGQRVTGKLSRMLLPTFLKLILMPLVALFVVKLLLSVQAEQARVVFLLAAMPPASTMVAIASNYGTREEAEAISSITCLATIVSMATIPCMLYVSSLLF